MYISQGNDKQKWNYKMHIVRSTAVAVLCREYLSYNVSEWPFLNQDFWMAECWSLTAEISKNVVSCFSICFILKLSLPFFFRGTSWQSFLFLSFSLDDKHYCHHKWLYECMWHYDILIVWHLVTGRHLV